MNPMGHVPRLHSEALHGGRRLAFGRRHWFAELALPKKTEGAVISVIRTVLAFLLIIGVGDVGLALDRVRVETGVDKAVAALGVS